MIGMGFEHQFVRVLDAMPSTNFKPRNDDEELDEKKIYRTTYMFSATMPPVVERLAKSTCTEILLLLALGFYLVFTRNKKKKSCNINTVLFVVSQNLLYLLLI